MKLTIFRKVNVKSNNFRNNNLTIPDNEKSHSLSTSDKFSIIATRDNRSKIQIKIDGIRRKIYIRAHELFDVGQGSTKTRTYVCEHTVWILE